MLMIIFWKQGWQQPKNRSSRIDGQTNIEKNMTAHKIWTIFFLQKREWISIKQFAWNGHTLECII